MPRIKLSKRTIDGLQPDKERFTAWDSDISGFGLRVMPSGERVYVLKYRVCGRQRWVTIGRHGSPWTPDMARTEAKRLLGEVASGLDPADKRKADRTAITFAELCDIYLAEGVSHKKPATLKADRGRIKHHLKPLLGSVRVNSITKADIERLLTDVKNGKTAAKTPAHEQRKRGKLPAGGSGVAAQCVALASTLFEFAIGRQLRPDNPAVGIKKPAVRKLERFLSEQELASLSDALHAEVLNGGNIYPVAAIRLLALTGCRRNEIIGLRWHDVDLQRMSLKLPDSKTREKVIYLSEPAVQVLRDIPRRNSNEHVIAGTLVGKPYTSLDKVWNRVKASSGLDGVRLHDLRHTFASVGAASGVGLQVVGKLLGHTQASTTARYSHLSDDPLRRAADAIGTTISTAMTSRRFACPEPKR